MTLRTAENRHHLMKSVFFHRKKRPKESSRECVWKKNIFAVECASLEALRRMSVPSGCSRGLSRLDDGLASGILVSRLVAGGVRSKGAPWWPRRATAGLAVRGVLLRGWHLRIRTRWSGRPRSCGRCRWPRERRTDSYRPQSFRRKFSLWLQPNQEHRSERP